MSPLNLAVEVRNIRNPRCEAEKILMLCSWLEDGGGHMAKNVSGLRNQRLRLADNLTSVLGPRAEKQLSHTVRDLHSWELVSGC